MRGSQPRDPGFKSRRGHEINLLERYIEQKVSDEQLREQLYAFVQWLKSKGLSNNRIYKYLYLLLSINKKFGIDLLEVNENSIRTFLVKLNSTNLAKWTKRDYIIIFRKWIEFLGEKNLLQYLEIPKITNQEITSKTILTEQEIIEMIKVADNLRDKLIVSLGYELGLRPHELLNLKIGDIELDERAVYISVNGKTGKRRLLTIVSVPYLKAYLNIHSDPRPTNYLIVNQYGRKLSLHRLNKIIKKLARKAGITKKITFYTLRHSRATHLAKYLTEQQLKVFFGWTMDSSMPKVYVHLSSRDLDEAILSLYGIKKKEHKSSLFKPKICNFCGEVNPIDAEYCMRCGRKISLINL